MESTHQVTAIGAQESDEARAMPSFYARRRILSHGLAVLAVGAAAVVAQPVFAGPLVPFKGLVTGMVQSTGATTFALTGSGIASGLGLSAHGGEVTVTSADPETGAITDTLVETFIAANGDRLTLQCTQIATPVGPGIYEATDQWIVVGGTGRFAGAKGSGTGDTSINLNAGTYVKQLKGSVSANN